MIGLGPRCLYCKHFHVPGRGKCSAFPNGIPGRFIIGDDEHVAPYEGDHGLQFELDPRLSPDAVRRYKKRFETPDN